MSIVELEAREVALEAPSGLWRDAWGRLRRNPGALIGLIGLHLYLIVRLGVSSPPWSKESAGSGPVEPEPTEGRSGLVQPRARVPSPI